MSKRDYTIGSSSVDNYFGWMNSRHDIYLARKNGDGWPWTDDAILQKYRFTNVFRQLDRTTQTVNRCVDYEADPVDVVFNIWWMRLFNHEPHMEGLGHVADRSVGKIRQWIENEWTMGNKVFTSAYMTTGQAGRPKWETYMEAVEDAAYEAEAVVEFCQRDGTMEGLWRELCKCFMVGKFVSYELVCDLRFVPELWPDGHPSDIKTWANIGPGARRGMERLGRDASVQTMRDLFALAPTWLSADLMEHYDTEHKTPFEMREIEHCLCEFDKYERVRTGAGRPRQNYKRKD